jgi:GNAT superfamily N-acetyltransferase
MDMLEIKSTESHQLSVIEIEKLHGIITMAYANTEKEIWGDNYTRLFLPEYTELVEKGEIYVAFYNGEIAGGVHLYKGEGNAYTYSLLGVDFNLGGKGIGSALIQTVENEAKAKGGTVMKIEILRVKSLEVPHKVVLAKFYERLGYTYTGSDDCSCKIPDWKVKLLVAPSDFDFYSKPL